MQPATDPGPPPVPELCWPAQQLVRVRRYLRFLGASRDSLDDLAQATTLAAVRTFAEEQAPLPWLLTTARNALRLHLRRLGRRREVHDLDRLNAAWCEQMQDDGGDAQRGALSECLGRLPERSRRVVELRYCEGLSREAIAAAVGIGVEGVKSLLGRVRQVLAECIQRMSRERRKGERSGERRAARRRARFVDVLLAEELATPPARASSHVAMRPQHPAASWWIAAAVVVAGVGVLFALGLLRRDEVRLAQDPPPPNVTFV
ncbi:MAG: sigma-70 family RNA polymerase sigma factor, partial [Planctomycetota bacterium]